MGNEICLDKQQQAAVEAINGPVLLLAVPGSGKTTTLITRLGHMVVDKGISPYEILTMTYTVAATEEMKNRFAKRFGESYADKMSFKTINAVCAGIIRDYEQCGHTAFRLVSDEGEISRTLIKIWLDTLKFYPTESDIKELRLKITYIKNQMVSKAELEKITLSTSNGKENIRELYEAYVNTMRNESLMDFDDQLVFAYAILKRNPDILNKYQTRYRYICVDEAQDTSLIQHKIIELLAQKHQNLFMVGDEDQSIYGFRAAYPQALLDFEKTWSNAKVLYIETNYRSTSGIVDAATDFIHQNKNRRNKNMSAKNGKGAKVKIVEVPDRIKQYDEIVKMARKAKSPITFLYRNNDTALPIIDMLDREGISYKVRGIDSLFFTNIIYRDVMNMFRLALDPTDAEAFMQIYYKLGLFIKKDIAAAAAAEGGNILMGLQEYVGGHTKRRLDEIAWNFKMIPKMSPANAIDMMETMGYRDYLSQKGIDMFRLDIMKNLATQEKTINAFLSRMEELRNIIKQGSKAEDAKVLLSTIHSAKGLEYDTVILTDVAGSVFPNAHDESELEEERRLFYVGMTRAKKELCIFSFKDDESEFTDYVKAYVSTGKHLNSGTLSAGQKIRHKYFGTGTVVSLEGDILTVDFGTVKNRERKTLNLNFVKENKIIQII